MADSKDILNRSFKDSEIKKLKDVLGTLIISLQHIDDIREQMKEDVAEVAEELDIKKSDINAAARAIYKHDFVDRRNKNKAIEELAEMAGYSVSDEDEE